MKKYNIITCVLMVIVCFCFSFNGWHVLKLKQQLGYESAKLESTIRTVNILTNYVKNHKKDIVVIRVSEIPTDDEEPIKIDEVVDVPNTVVYSYNENQSNVVYNNTYFTDDQLARLPEKYTVDDLRMLCTMVYGECGEVTGEVDITFYDGYTETESTTIDASYMHKLCAIVLLNRLLDDRFPDNIYDNLVRPGQYAVKYTHESTTTTYSSGHPELWYNVVNECLECLNQEFDVPNTIIFQSNYSYLGTAYYATIYVPYLRSTSYYAFG